MAVKPYFKTVDPKVNFPKLEEDILSFWKKEKVFEKSVDLRPESKKWTFLDGPPFITGLPHYGTLLSSIPKDLFPRYKTMHGFRVRRVWGWDCHGLPAENKVEKKLGLKSKRDIEEKIGVKRFIEECKQYVSETSGEWEWYVDHIGRWVDFKNSYKTMDLPYMESVMWVFRQMYDKGFIYKGLRVSLYCPHCQTPISNFEVAMDAENYKDVTEHATTYKYQVDGEENTYLLAWSTTPWNKIATPALAVNPKLKYVKVEANDEYFILAESRLNILDEKYKITSKFLGKDLVGKKFIPHYDYYKVKAKKDQKLFEVVGGSFVTAEEGTGIVTIAAYGEDDLKLMQKENIYIELHVGDDGYIKSDVPKFGGRYFMDASESVDNDLEKRGLIYKREKLTHSVAHCWRCATRLFHNPQNAWYVNVQKLKPSLKKNNEKINWVPPHFKYGRFLKSMESAPDWCISRSRYWGSPVPVWECTCGERYIPSSIKELEELSGQKIVDLHKPQIDDVVIKCKKCGNNAKRVAEVLDSWIEAGSASFAERHFPFEKGIEDLKDFFPPDFIVEYTGQIRAWFYVLHVIATSLYDSNAFKNVVVTGVILGTDGRKMSKNFGNYPDPKMMIQKYGGDALRLYLLGSPVMSGEDILISEEQYRNQVKNFLLPLWNVYNFFVTYTNLEDWHPSDSSDFKSMNVLDRWIKIKFDETVGKIEEAYESFDTQKIVGFTQEFLVNDLSGWYTRLSRGRFGHLSDKNDKLGAFETLYFILKNFSQVLAPLIPFATEEIYKNLSKLDSVHLSEWPKVGKLESEDKKLLSEMKLVREVVEQGHALRKKSNIAVRQPLQSIKVLSKLNSPRTELVDLICQELNIKAVEWMKGAKNSYKLNTRITPILEEEGKTRDLIRQIQVERKKLGIKLDHEIDVISPWLPMNTDFIQLVKSKTLAKNLAKGTFLVKP